MQPCRHRLRSTERPCGVRSIVSMAARLCTWSVPSPPSEGWCWRNARWPIRAASWPLLPELLDGLDLRGCLVSLDALAGQPAVAERVVSRGGDYLITLKGNQRKTHAEVKDWFAAHAFAPGAPLRPCCDAFDRSRGRLERIADQLAERA